MKKLFDSSTAVELYNDCKKAMDALQHYMEGVYVCFACLLEYVWISMCMYVCLYMCVYVCM